MSDGKPQPEESDDVAPGAMESAGHTIRAGVQGYLIGKPFPIFHYAALIDRAGGNTMEPARKTG